MHTSRRSIGQYDCLEPHGEEVHDREVAYCDEEIRHANQDRNFLFEKRWREDWFRGYEEFNQEKEDGKYTC